MLPWLLRTAARRITAVIPAAERELLRDSFGTSLARSAKSIAISPARPAGVLRASFQGSAPLVGASFLSQMGGLSGTSRLTLPLPSVGRFSIPSVGVELPVGLPLVSSRPGFEPSSVLRSLPQIQLIAPPRRRYREAWPATELQMRFGPPSPPSPVTGTRWGGSVPPPSLRPEANRRRRDGRKLWESESYLRANALITKVWNKPSEVLDFFRAFGQNTTLEGGLFAWQVSQFMDVVYAREAQLIKRQLYDTGRWPFPIGIQRLSSIVRGRHWTPWGF